MAKKGQLCNIASAPAYPWIWNDAQMAELVDASDSKSGIGNNVQVRFLFWAQRPSDEVGGLFCLGASITEKGIHNIFPE